jgi:hypothetical protein
MTGAVLAAHQEGARRHSKRTAFEYIAYSCFRNGSGAWDENQAGELTFAHTLEQAFGAFNDLGETAESEYVDFHAWHFVPSSFMLVVEELRFLGQTTFEVARTFDSAGCEFYVSLRKTGQKSRASLASPEVTARRLELMNDIMRELSQQPAFA